MAVKKQSENNRAKAINKGSWNVFRPFISAWMKKKFNYTPQVCNEDGPFIVLANHNTDWDPLLLVPAFPHFMRFVASEHIFRWGMKSDIIVYFQNPIARLKGTTATSTARDIFETVKSGASVAMFPEGNRSFNGVTGDVFAATGKLIRFSGVKLITYRFEGGYLTSPRWSNTLRRGRISGKIVNVYSAETVKKMSAEEINRAIEKDLFEDAYETQSREPIAYHGKNLAENLETIFCVCPKCGRIGTLESSGDTVFCECGFAATYDEYGYLKGADIPADNIRDWDSWQTEKLTTLIENTEVGGPILCDDDMELIEILPNHTEKQMGTGQLVLYKDRLECCGLVIGIRDLIGFAVHGAQTIDMSVDGHAYEIRSDKKKCTRKYMTLIDYLKTKGE